MGLPNSVIVFWWMLLWPLILAAAWRSWVRPPDRVVTRDS
jgi:hypothetical protein